MPKAAGWDYCRTGRHSARDLDSVPADVPCFRSGAARIALSGRLAAASAPVSVAALAPVSVVAFADSAVLIRPPAPVAAIPLAAQNPKSRHSFRAQAYLG